MAYYSTGNYYIEDWGNTFRVRKCRSSCYEYQWGDEHFFRTKGEAEAFVAEKCPKLKYEWIDIGGTLHTIDARDPYSILEPYVDSTVYVNIGGHDEVADYGLLNGGK